MNNTKFGVHIYSVGGNQEVSYLSGVNVKKIKTLAYLLGGVVSAVVGIMLTGRLYSAQPTAGMLYELDAIAACAIGGIRLGGGVGVIWGTLIGVLIIGVINNGFNLMNVTPLLATCF